jgi:aromatic-L-amino-acid/L-tryptophan decarboxylase
VLRVIADEAGLSEAVGGCFVSGGSAGNLSALAVARATAKRRLGDVAVGQRLQVVVGTDAQRSSTR